MINRIPQTYLDRRAMVYLRQSSMRQVHEHRESTARQYALQERAVELGWEVGRIEVIDDDLGQSGMSTDWRTGFQHLAEEVAHGSVGAIFALEVSRLARSSADWHRLLDLCGLADVLIADEQAVYNPRDYNDKLLLGLKGTMSEAEQYWMRLRLQGGKQSKARRGELFLLPPTGYQWDESTRRLRLDPDEHIQQAVKLVFERFRLDGSAYAVMRYFARHGLTIPVRDASTGEAYSAPPRHALILAMLHNPIYTGAYVFGRREERRALVDGKVHRRRVERLPMEQWKTCIKDIHPRYITWEEFMSNQRKLHENRTAPFHLPAQPGAAREGHALLQGLALCGRCGHRMGVRYHGARRRTYYECRAPMKNSGAGVDCWSVSGQILDDAVADLFLQAVQPPEVELGLAVARETERQSKELDQQWKLRLDRASYDARLAERRYKAVDPDNRVVARTLEREWNDKQKELEELQRQHAEARHRDLVDLSTDDRRRVLALATDLPRVWRASTTTPAERKNLLRMLVKEVTLSPIDLPMRATRVQVLWQTGTVTELNVARQDKHTAFSTPPAAVETIRALTEAGKSDVDIVTALNSRGLSTGRRQPWSASAIRWTRWRHGIRREVQANERLPERRQDGLYSVRGVAAHLDVTEHIVRYWVEKGWLKIAEGGDRQPLWFRLDRATLERLRAAKARGYGPGGHRHSQC